QVLATPAQAAASVMGAPLNGAGLGDAVTAMTAVAFGSDADVPPTAGSDPAGPPPVAPVGPVGPVGGVDVDEPHADARRTRTGTHRGSRRADIVAPWIPQILQPDALRGDFPNPFDAGSVNRNTISHCNSWRMRCGTVSGQGCAWRRAWA